MPIYLPEKCLRGLSDCQPMSQIESDCGDSFICCGENNGADRVIATDRYTVCWKNDVIDDRSHWDFRDLADTVGVLAQGMSVIANREDMK